METCKKTVGMFVAKFVGSKADPASSHALRKALPSGPPYAARGYGFPGQAFGLPLSKRCKYVFIKTSPTLKKEYSHFLWFGSSRSHAHGHMMPGEPNPSQSLSHRSSTGRSASRPLGDRRSEVVRLAKLVSMSGQGINQPYILPIACSLLN